VAGCHDWKSVAVSGIINKLPIAGQVLSL
jgi:hypothetical protein